MSAPRTAHPPHVGLCRCAIAVLVASLCVYSTIIGLGEIINSIAYGHLNPAVGSGDYTEYPIVAVHSLTPRAAIEWCQWHLLPVVGLVGSVVFLNRRSPRWLARIVRGAR